MIVDLTQIPTQACQTCDVVFTQGYKHYLDGSAYKTEWLTDTICGDCQQTARFSPLSAGQRQQVDELIYQRAILEGIKLLKTSLGIGLGDSTALYSWRYRKLREANPRKFSSPDEQYWAGFYS